MSLPDIFVIGAMKSGTSTVWKALFQCEAFDPTMTKEVNFFLEEQKLQILERAYEKQFCGAADNLRVDVSPNYSRRHIFPGVAQRIFKLKPSAKIIYLIRNPIDRIISHLQHDIYRDRIRRDRIEKVLKEKDDYVLTSSYYYQIQDYLSLFGKDSILIAEMETLQNRPQEFWTVFADFLEIPRFSVSSQSYNVYEKRYLIKYHDSFHRMVSNRHLKKAYHLFWYFMNIKYPKPMLSQELRQYLIDKLKPDIENLAREFPIEVNKWLK